MGFLGSAVLILVGVMAAADDLSRRYPGLKLWIDALTPFQSYLGLGAGVYGFFLTFKTLAYIRFIFHEPFIFLATLAAALVAVALGVLLGGRVLRVVLSLEKRLSETQLQTLALVEKRLEQDRLSLGYAAIWLGGFALLLNVFV